MLLDCDRAVRTDASEDTERSYIDECGTIGLVWEVSSCVGGRPLRRKERRADEVSGFWF